MLEAFFRFVWAWEGLVWVSRHASDKDILVTFNVLLRWMFIVWWMLTSAHSKAEGTNDLVIIFTWASILMKFCDFKMISLRPSTEADYPFKSGLIPPRRPFQISQCCVKTKCKFKSSLNASIYNIFYQTKDIRDWSRPFPIHWLLWKCWKMQKSPVGSRGYLFIISRPCCRLSFSSASTEPKNMLSWHHLTRRMGESAVKPCGDLKAMQIQNARCSHKETRHLWFRRDW